MPSASAQIEFPSIPLSVLLDLYDMAHHKAAEAKQRKEIK